MERGAGGEDGGREAEVGAKGKDGGREVERGARGEDGGGEAAMICSLRMVYFREKREGKRGRS